MSVTPEQLAAMQQELAELRSTDAQRQIEMARWQVYSEHPHLRGMGLLESFQGSPDQIRDFGNKLAERFPVPAPTPAPLTQAPQPPTAPAVPPPPAPAPPPAPQPPQVVPPESLAVPTPSPQDILTQQTADMARANDIRDRMAQGLATRAEVLWLSQNGPRREEDLGNGHMGMTGGFVAAVKHFGAQREAVRR